MEMFKQIMLIIAKIAVQAANAILNPTAKYLAKAEVKLIEKGRVQAMKLKAMKLQSMKLGAGKDEAK